MPAIETKSNPLKLQQIFAKEWCLLLTLFSCIAVQIFRKYWFATPIDPLTIIVVFAWLFCNILYSSWMVVRHAEALAKLLKEPLGTLVLTLSVISIEIVMIASIMLSRQDVPTLARDTMYAVIMIGLNGIVGLSLLVGGWRHREQYFNLQGSGAFLSVILVLGVLGLILPTYTVSTRGPTLSSFLSAFLIIISLVLYTVFLLMQTGRHRLYFTDSTVNEEHGHAHHAHRTYHYPIGLHLVFLIGYLLVTIFLCENITIPIGFIVHKLAEPAALGGFIVAVLVLSPEAVTAIRAAWANHMQRSINISLGAVLATTGLTIPAALIVGFIIHKPVILGLNRPDSLMLILTLLVSTLTFSTGKTNILQGVLHILLFATFIMLIFD